MGSKDPRKWFKLTCESVRHPKIVALSPATRWAWIELLAYAVEYETDGFIPLFVAKKCAKNRQIVDLKRVGLVQEKEGDESGLLLHDFLEHQESKADLEKSRRKKQNAGSLGGKLASHQRWHVQAGKKSASCQYCREALT